MAMKIVGDIDFDEAIKALGLKPDCDWPDMPGLRGLYIEIFEEFKINTVVSRYGIDTVTLNLFFMWFHNELAPSLEDSPFPCLDKDTFINYLMILACFRRQVEAPGALVVVRYAECGEPVPNHLRMPGGVAAHNKFWVSVSISHKDRQLFLFLKKYGKGVSKLPKSYAVSTMLEEGFRFHFHYPRGCPRPELKEEDLLCSLDFSLAEALRRVRSDCEYSADLWSDFKPLRSEHILPSLHVMLGTCRYLSGSSAQLAVHFSTFGPGQVEAALKENMRAVLVPITDDRMVEKIHGMPGGNFYLMWHDITYHFFLAYRCTDYVRSIRLKAAESIRTFFQLESGVMTKFIWCNLIDFEYSDKYMNAEEYLKELLYLIDPSSESLFESLLAFASSVFNCRELDASYTSLRYRSHGFSNIPKNADFSKYVERTIIVYADMRGLDAHQLFSLYQKYGLFGKKNARTRCLEVFVRTSDSPGDFAPIDDFKRMPRTASSVSLVSLNSFFSEAPEETVEKVPCVRGCCVVS